MEPANLSANEGYTTARHKQGNWRRAKATFCESQNIAMKPTSEQTAKCMYQGNPYETFRLFGCHKLGCSDKSLVHIDNPLMILPFRHAHRPLASSHDNPTYISRSGSPQICNIASRTNTAVYIPYVITAKVFTPSRSVHPVLRSKRTRDADKRK